MMGNEKRPNFKKKFVKIGPILSEIFEKEEKCFWHGELGGIY